MSATTLRHTASASTVSILRRARCASTPATQRRFLTLTRCPISPRELFIPSVPQTVLDTLETSVLDRTVLSSPERRSRVGNTCNALEATATDQEQRERVARIRQCGQVWLVARGDDGEYLLTRRCHERLCPECQLARARKYQKHYEEQIKVWKKPKLLTLTLKGNTDPPSKRLTDIVNAFRRLRSFAVWKQQVSGGYYVVEMTHNATTNNWHVHLHVLMDARFIDKDWLHKQWQNITGDSFMTSIKVADKNTAKYLSKYVGSPVKNVLSDDDPWWLYEQFRGRRLAQGFGNAPAINDDEHNGDDVEIIGTFSEVLEKALRGDNESKAIVARLTYRYGKKLPDVNQERQE